MTAAIETEMLKRPPFKSTFAHMLRVAGPRPVNEHLDHMTAAVLGARYNFTLMKDEEGMSLRMSLPNYAGAAEGEANEGSVSFEEGVEVDEKVTQFMSGMAEETYPAKMLAQMAPGLLKTMFEYVDSQMSLIRSEDNKAAVAALKKASVAINSTALETFSKVLEGMEEGQRSVITLDPILAQSELAVLEALRDNEACNEELKAYFTKVIELFNELEKDDSEDPEPEDDEHHHQHEGGCCGHHH